MIENFSGPVDLSATSVVSTGGNIIRNSGTGLRMYASGKITTTNNILLGPSDEFIPSPDIHDSDFNSLNITVDRTVGMQNADAPIIQYIRDGNPFDLRASRGIRFVSTGIGTIVGQGTTNETLGPIANNVFVPFTIRTPDLGEFGRENGYIKFEVIPAEAQNLGLSSALGYQIIGQEFLANPVGYTTFVGIETGLWRNASGIVTDVQSTVATGQTDYHVQLLDPAQFPAIAVGDVVKLFNHNASPSLSAVEFTVAERISVNAAVKRLRLFNPQVFNSQTDQYVTGFNLAGDTTLNNCRNGVSAPGDYISIRDRFVIAKGRVGVT